MPFNFPVYHTIYMLYNRGLSTILLSGNITTYPSLCARVTATFSVLSDTINSVKSTLLNNDSKNKNNNNHQRADITTVITQLQKAECEKLNLTAALHLERLRLRNSELDATLMNDVGEEGIKGDDDKTVQLLKDGIHSLETKVSSVIESINDVLEELRCIAVEESE